MSTTPDQALLVQTTGALKDAAAKLLQRFSQHSRPADLDQLLADIAANDDAVLPDLQARLLSIRPAAGWIDDEEEGGALPAGELWLVDPVEGNINHIHGLPGWGVTATLIRDAEPYLAVVHLPLSGETYTAIKGQGAFLNGTRISVSQKSDLNAALVGTGQGKPHEDAQTYQRIGSAVAAMLQASLLVQASVPATLPLVDVAAGRMDLFWQHSQVRSGLLAGALLVAEAGGTVSDLHGNPWTVESQDFLAAAPNLHGQAVAVLSNIL